MKSCTPIASRARATGQASPKRLQNSPGVQAGGKSSPKKVKLGLHHPLMPAPWPKSKGPLPFQPAHLPFSSTPKGQGRKELWGTPWSGCPSAERGTPKAEPASKKPAKEPEKSHPGKDSAARREGGQEDRQWPKCPKVEPVQKQLVSRADFSHQGSDDLPDPEEDAGRLFADQCVAAWAGTSSHQKDREQHLRLYHQQFQQPPLLRQKLDYQPLEKFLARYKSQEVQVRPEAPCPDSASPQGRDETMQLEELDDSDFSEDSFSPGPGRKKAEREAGKQSSQNSFFLHRRDFRAGGRDGQEEEQELFCKWYALEKEGRAFPSEEDSSSYEGGGGRSLCDWSSGEIPALGSSPHRGVPEKPYCSKEDGLAGHKFDSPGWPRSSDPSPGSPDGHFSPPRKRTPSPPLAAILLEPPFPGKRGLPKGTDFRGAFDFPMELADDTTIPLPVSFLRPGSAETRGKKRADGEEVLGQGRCWEEEAVGDSRQPSGSSLYEINHWGRRAELALPPGSEFQWRPQSCGCPADASIVEAAPALGECVCGYPGEGPLAELFPLRTEERASMLCGNPQTREYSSIYDSDPEGATVSVSWSYSDHLALGEAESPVLLAPSSPVDKEGGLSPPPKALPISGHAGDKPPSEPRAPSLSGLAQRTGQLRHSEEACRKEEIQNTQSREDAGQDSGAEPKGTTVAQTGKDSPEAGGQVDLAGGSLKEKDTLGT